jgi:hypothetical protein
MAKSYYSLDEACEKLSLTETQIKDLVRGGKLREFRDGGKVNYRVDDVDKLVSASGLDRGPGDSAGGSGGLVLEPAEESGVDLESASAGSGIDLTASGSDVISLAETDLDDTAISEEKKDKKDDTVVTSVGVSVFEDDDTGVDKADPVAETVVSEGGLGIEGVGSGSGLLDLTRESDDTSLGAELLDEIYPGEPGEMSDMGEATRAGLDEVVPAAAVEEVAETAEATAAAPVAVVTRLEYGPDAVSTALTGLMGVAVLVMCVAGLSVAAVIRGAVPSLLDILYPKLWIFGAGSAGAALIAGLIGFFLGKRSG